MLFSTFNNEIVLLLFLYLGVLSGFIYAFSNTIILKLQQGTKHLKIAAKKGIKDDKKDKKIGQNKLKNKEKTREKEQKRGKNRRYFYKLKSFLLTSVNYLLEGLKAMVLALIVILCYLINLKLNMGNIRVLYLIIWLFAFFIGKRVYNLLANYILSFYNYIRKKGMKHE